MGRRFERQSLLINQCLRAILHLVANYLVPQRNRSFIFSTSNAAVWRKRIGQFGVTRFDGRVFEVFGLIDEFMARNVPDMPAILAKTGCGRTRVACIVAELPVGSLGLLFEVCGAQG